MSEPSHRRHTRTPKAEAGGISRRSSISSSSSGSSSGSIINEDAPVPYGASRGERGATRNASVDGEYVPDEDVAEDEALLGPTSQLASGPERPRRSGAFTSLKLDDGLRRQGWIRIAGLSLPKPLLYLFCFPPILILLSLLSRLSTSPSRPHHPTLSNGTHSFHPTTLLISLDGFRPSYLTSHPHLLSNLVQLGASDWGVKAESMQPVFPTLTFPNHWSLMTGLYPESHGIVANDFWDPIFPTSNPFEDERQTDGDGDGAHFVYTEEEKSWEAAWWWGEPIWSVVERVGRKSAVIMWPGPPVTSAGIAPSYFVPYRNLSPLQKLDQVFAYLDKPVDDRPEFIAAYFPEIDQNGHRTGPVSQGVNESLAAMDEMIAALVEGLEARNLNDIVNVVIVSDHGMTETSNTRMIYLDDILGEDGVDAIEHKDGEWLHGWPSVGLRFKHGTDVEQYSQRLRDAADRSNGTFAVYTHETMPERWHFSHGHRIAPIYVVPYLGWAITDHHEHFVIYQGDYQPKGNHGYDNTFAEMQAIFFARGPVARRIKEHSSDEGFVSSDPAVLKGFRNLEIFSLVTGLLGLADAEPPHNGTIGFWDQYL